MNDLFHTSPQGPTMSSREIADLVESRHDKVKQSIERLVYGKIIAQPPVGDEQDLDLKGRSSTTVVYLLTKRESGIPILAHFRRRRRLSHSRRQDSEQEASQL